MLARRFTIVCLLIAMFGMAFSILVAQTGHRNWTGETAPYPRAPLVLNDTNRAL